MVAGLLLLLLSGCGSQLDSALVASRTVLLYDRGQLPDNGVSRQEEDVPQLLEEPSLDDYVRYGLYHNPAIRSAFERWRAAVYRIPQVTELPDPRFTYGYFIEPVQTRTGPQNNRFSLAQTFPWFGKLSQRNVGARHVLRTEPCRHR